MDARQMDEQNIEENIDENISEENSGEESQHKIDPILSDEDLKTLRRVTRAWKCILEDEQILTMAKSNTAGMRGLSLFKFLRPGENKERQYNCEYYFGDDSSPLWAMLTKNMSEHSRTLLNSYEPETSFAVCISVPEHDAGDLTFQEIKIFNSNTNREIP